MHVREIRIVVAATAIALIAAGSAHAEPATTTTPAKKGCSIKFEGPGAGQSIVYPHGYSMTVKGANDGKTHTYTCNDGAWKETVSLTAAPRGAVTPVPINGTLVGAPVGGTLTIRRAPLGGTPTIRPVRRAP